MIIDESKSRKDNKNTAGSNIREFLLVDILNGKLKRSDMDNIIRICKGTDNTVDSLKESAKNIKDILVDRRVDKKVIKDGIDPYVNSDSLVDLKRVLSSVLKTIRTSNEVVKYVNEHPFAKVNKFSSFYKAYVCNGDASIRKLLGGKVFPKASNPSDVILVFKNGAPEFLCREPDANSEIKGKYVIGISLKSSDVRNKRTGFKNPGAIPFAKALHRDLGGGGKYPDYTKGLSTKFVNNISSYVRTSRDEVKRIACDPNNDLGMDVKGKLTPNSTFKQFKVFYKDPDPSYPSTQTFSALAQTVGRGVQAGLRDALVEIYQECTKTDEGQSALMEHILEYWFSVNAIYPQYFIYEINGDNYNGNMGSYEVKTMNWTKDEVMKMMGNGRFRVHKRALDAIEIDTENGTNVFSCRFKFNSGISISAMKMGASSAFGELIEGSTESYNPPEYSVPFTGTVNIKDDINKIKEGINKLISSGNYTRGVITESKKYDAYILSYFGADRRTINESKNTNTHIEHMEDMLFNGGVNGTREAINVARYVRDLLSGKVSSKNISMKFDGRVSVVVGRDPSDNKFFVAKKSAFNKNPIVYKSISEINQADLPSDLKKTFIDMYRYLDHNVVGIYQGDLLFTKDSKKQVTIDGVKGISFHPNTIVYFIPQDSIDLYKEINTAKIGIAWHTAYTGTSLDNLQAKSSDDIAPLFASKDVYSIGSGIRDGQTFNLSEKDKGDIDKQLTEIGKLFQKMNPSILNDIKETEQLKSLMKSFYNSKIKQNSSVGDIKKYVKELIDFINEKYQGMIDKLKTSSAKERREIEKESVLSYFTKYSASDIEDVFRLFQLLSNIKHTLLRHLNRVGNMNTFIRTNEGYRVTNQEGFVVANEDGNTIKLVDRLEFSKNNFSPDVIKGWTR